MEIVIIVLLILLNGAFAMSELALAASRKGRLKSMAEEGDGGAKAALSLLDNPNQFLSTVQVGITSIGVLNGIVGEAAFSDGLAAVLLQWGLSARASEFSATALVVTLITFFTIIFGELVPKRIGQLYPEPVARLMSRPMLWLATAAKPFVKLLSATTQGTLKLLKIDTTLTRAMTEEEIAHSLEEGVDAGVIEHHEHQMVQNVFHLDERPLTSLMIPRSDVRWLESGKTVRECLQWAGTLGEQDTHSWYPVCRNSLDEVLGIISLGKLLALGAEHSGTIEKHVQSAMFVPETLSGMELLDQFRESSGRMVFVVDEYGVVQGLLTPRDLLEAITGELKAPGQVDAWATSRGDGSWLIDGLIPVGELKSQLDIKELPEEDRGHYNTLAGLLMYVSGQLPQTGERIECAQWTFEVVDLDGKRIDKVLAHPMPTQITPINQ